MSRHRHWNRCLTVLLATAVLRCAGSSGPAQRPAFPPPRGGVFQDPVPIVKSTDDDLQPSIVPTTSVVAYAAKSSDDGNLDIYVRPLAGGAAVRLTTHSTDDADPELSPNAKLIAWSAQSEDVKGDIWVMDADGDDKRQLTDRKTGDRAPTWSPDGKTIYFTSRARGAAVPRIDAIDLSSGSRRTVVKRGWDPGMSNDGTLLFFAALDDKPRPRLFAQRLTDGRVAAITDGAAIEGMPRVARGVQPPLVLFTRWVDDQTGDGRVDADDPPSLWSVEVAAGLFDGDPPSTPRPLTPGEGGEIFASVMSDWMVYTTAGFGDLEIYALPADGIINTAAGAEAILAASRAEANPALRRLGLRYLVATAPSLESSARYELARELAERGRYSDAIGELKRVAKDGGELGAVARIEVERLSLLERLRGELLIREEEERIFADERRSNIAAVAAEQPDSVAVQSRYLGFAAEIDFAFGLRGVAVTAWERLAAGDSTPPEDGARALGRLGQAYATLRDLDAVARVSEITLRRYAGERHYVRRAAERWVEVARTSEGVSPMAALERIASAETELSAAAARAAVALAREQESKKHADVALREWRRIAERFAGEREVLSQALLRLAEAAERQNDPAEATKAYERLIAEFADSPTLRARAAQGITRINLKDAGKRELAGDRKAARDSYGRVLRGDDELVTAHRKYISLSAGLGELQRVLETYRKRAESSPRDRFARYGYGYALTFARSPDLNAARREVEAALALDPRFAAAHLTLGWIREQLEARGGGSDLLAKADLSYGTAESLLDREMDAELWANTQLNRGNVLRKLGKMDDAFTAYLARELSGVRFEDPLSELLFRENFARVALRETAYDVALDMARLGEELSRKLPGTPRRATLAALVAALGLQTGLSDDAVVWYERAGRLHAEREDWARVVPMLRGKMLAQRLLGRDDDALQTAKKLLEILMRGDGPEEPVGSMLGNLLKGEFVTEVPASPKNVTRAIYGFSSVQEEEITRAALSRVMLERGNYASAQRFAAQRLELVREAVVDGRLGPRIQREFLRALYESTALALRLGDYEEATLRAGEALRLAQRLGAWGTASHLIDGFQAIWGLDPSQRTPELLDLCRSVATAGIQAATVADRATTRRLAHWQALDQFGQIKEVAPPTATEPGKRLAQLLEALDTSRKTAEAALDFARLAVADETESSAIVTHLEGYLGESTAAATGVDETVVAAAPLSWRWRFDRSLWDKTADVAGPEPRWFLAAIEAFERAPQPENGPERAMFLATAVALLLERDEAPRAWRLLERNRLLELQPQVRRVGRPALAEPWAAVRAARNDPELHAKKLGAAPGLVAVLEGKPSSLDAVQNALGEDAILIQAFAPLPDRWHWFAIDAGGVRHVTAAEAPGRDIDNVIDTLWPADSSKLAQVYIDTGELLALSPVDLHWGGARLADRMDIAEVPSASYLAAAARAQHLPDDETLALGEPRQAGGLIAVPEHLASRQSLERFGSGRVLVHVSLRSEFGGTTTNRPDEAQVIFQTAPNIEPGDRLDLDTIAALDLKSGVALVEIDDPPARVRRALAQAFLLAGIPTVIAVRDRDTAVALRDTLRAGLSNRRAATIASAALRDGTAGVRLIGHRGWTLEERVDFAVGEVLRLAKAGGPTYKRAKTTGDTTLWRTAKGYFSQLLDTIAYLRRPDSAAQLGKSKHRLAGAIAPRLPKYELDNRGNLAQIHLALGEIDEAAALQDLIAKQRELNGEEPMLATVLLALGKSLAIGRRFSESANAFGRCADSAAGLDEAVAKKAKVDKTALEADCRSRLGSVWRELSEHDKALRSYQQSIMLYAGIAHRNELYPRRYLGFFYADVLNEYGNAIDQFRAALAAAERFDVKEMIIPLSIDITRVLRQRGDYEQALVQVASADERSKDASAENRADVALEAAKIYWYRGNYRRALGRQRQALELARLVGDTFREIQAVSLGGLIALNQGDLVEAERSVQAALDLSRITQRRGEMAAQLNNLGTIYRQAGRIPAAINAFGRALAIDEALGSTEGRAYDLRNLGVALGQQGKHQAALVRLDEALELSRSIGNRYNELQCLFARGEELEAIGRAGVRDMYEAAAALAQRISVPEVEWRSLYALGRLAEREGDAETARTAYASALSVAERLGRGRSESTARHNRNDLYSDSVRLAVAAGDIEKAHLFVEQARARDLLDVLATRTVALPGDRAKALLEAELRASEARVAATRGVAVGDEEAEEQLRAADAALLEARDELRRAFPRLARAFTIDPVPVATLQKSLPEGTVVVSYLVGRRVTTLLAATPSELVVREVQVEQAVLVERVRRLRQGLRAFGSVDDELLELSRVLVEPIAATLAGAKTLVIIPHGVLNHVPFAALQLDGEPLLMRMAVTGSPSGSALHDRLVANRRAPVRRVLALAPSGDLPFSTLEARAIAGDAAVIGLDATEARVRDARVDALALAAHGELDARDPLSTAIRLHAGAGQDGRLEVHEIFALQQLPSLVTLSACDAAGSEMHGNEWLGLAGAFLTAGASTVVASSNRVSDLAAAVVMKRFYRGLNDQPAGEALRQAALTARRYFPHPAHWSSFVLLGDFR